MTYITIIMILMVFYLLIGEGIYGALHESDFFIEEDGYNHFGMMIGWLPFFVIAGVASLYWDFRGWK